MFMKEIQFGLWGNGHFYSKEKYCPLMLHGKFPGQSNDFWVRSL